jgi:hypothetical protein
MEAVLNVKQSLQVVAVVDVQVVVWPPGDQEPADGEVHSPRSQRGAAHRPLQGGEAEEQERDAETERQRFAGGQDDEEGELTCGGLRSAGSWGSDDLPKGHSWYGEEGCDEGYLDPGLQGVLLSLA